MSNALLVQDKLALRYAKALFSMALENDALDWVIYNINALSHLFDSQPNLSTWLSSPSLSQGAQQRFVAEYLFEDAHWLIRRFLTLLVINRRLVYLPFIAKQFSALVDTHKKIATAKVTTAVPLSEEKVNQLKVTLKQRFQLNDIRLTQFVDSQILGGLVIELLDQRIDSSLATQLAHIQRILVPNRVSLPA